MYDIAVSTAIDRGADDDAYYAEGALEMNATVAMRSLDLRNRGIRGIAAGGLSCYTMVGAQITPRFFGGGAPIICT